MTPGSPGHPTPRPVGSPTPRRGEVTDRPSWVDVTCYYPRVTPGRTTRRRRWRAWSTSSPPRARPQKTSPVLHLVITKSGARSQGETAPLSPGGVHTHLRKSSVWSGLYLYSTFLLLVSFL